MKNLQNTSKHQKDARKTLQKFGYSVLKQIRALLESYGSSSVKRKVLLMQPQKFERSDIACWDKWDRLFPNIRFLLSKMQYSSDITLKIRRFSTIFWNLHLQNLDRIEKKLFGRYILKKPNIRQKKRILNSLIVPKNVKGEPFEIF